MVATNLNFVLNLHPLLLTNGVLRKIFSQLLHSIIIFFHFRPNWNIRTALTIAVIKNKNFSVKWILKPSRTNRLMPTALSMLPKNKKINEYMVFFDFHRNSSFFSSGWSKLSTGIKPKNWPQIITGLTASWNDSMCCSMDVWVLKSYPLRTAIVTFIDDFFRFYRNYRWQSSCAHDWAQSTFEKSSRKLLLNNLQITFIDWIFWVINTLNTQAHSFILF